MYSLFKCLWRCLEIAKQNDALLINDEIKIPEVMVIGPNGEKLGMKSIEDARTLAMYAGLDLVLMTEKPTPVCKVIDYNKFRYEKQKKEKEAKKKQRDMNLEVKEYRLSITIDVHDFETKVRNAKAYLLKGHKIKVAIRLKGRQMAHTDLAREVIERFIKSLEDVATVENEAKLEGRFMNALLAPLK